MAGTISVKKAISERLDNELKAIDLRRGVAGSLLNSFYKNNPGTFPEPLKSVRALLKCFEWPRDYTFVMDFPKEGNLDWSDEVNGVTNDGKNWFIIQKDRIWKFPLGHDLRNSAGMFQTGIPDDLYKKGYNHFGASSHYHHPVLGGLLFVPLEGDGLPAKILLFKLSPTGEPVYSDSITLVSDEVLETGETKLLYEAPWCAINPLNGLLYTSDFNNNDNANFLYVYEPVYPVGGNRFDVRYKGKFHLYTRKGEPSKIRVFREEFFLKTDTYI